MVPGTATPYTTTSRTAVIVSASGVVDAKTTFTMGSSEYFSGIASADGSRFYLGGSAGIKTVAYGAAGTAATVLSASATIRGGFVHTDGSLFFATGT